MEFIKSLWAFITGKKLWTNVAAALILLVLVITLVSLWLKNYTNHRQQLTLPDFTEMSMETATVLAKDQSFQIVINDSVHIVGQSGGTILNQKPKPDSKVKEGRKVYVTVTKRNPDMVAFRDLPVLYGKNYERKKRELAIGFKLESNIVGRKFDPGPPGHILEVIYKSDTIVTRRSRDNNISIPKGGSLSFIVSKDSGGEAQIPNLVCETYESAKFILNSYRLQLGGADADGTVTDFDDAYVWKQEPAYQENKKIEMGSGIKLFLTQAKPPECATQSVNFDED